MTEATAWFDRTFDFSFSLEMLPNIEARLRGTPARLEDVMRRSPSWILVRKPDGKWSAQEHAGHLLDLEPLWLARVEDYVVGSEGLTPTDLSNRKTDEANHNERRLEEILDEIREARNMLLARVRQLDPCAFLRTIPHPRLGAAMRLIDHLYFVAEHDDHHLARIWALIQEGQG